MVICGCVAVVAMLIVFAALFSPSSQNQNPTPFSDSTSQHGAKAAFELLQKSGYRVERQNAPLSDAIDPIDAHTTLVLAAPYLQDMEQARGLVKRALDQGARVLATGSSGAMLLPESHLDDKKWTATATCEAQPNDFGELAGSGKVEMRPGVYWEPTHPLQRVEYTCHGDPVVVRYRFGKGEVIWWADSFPLENAGIERVDNVNLFLKSIGPTTNRVLWDESLHGASRSLWSYADSLPLRLVWGQLALIALLLLFSFGRRSGPLRPDPVTLRTAPLEFVHSLGSLYRKARATNVAVAITYKQLRLRLERQFSIPRSFAAENPVLLVRLASRLGAAAKGMRKDFAASEEAASSENMSTRDALALVRALKDDEALIMAQAVPTRFHEEPKLGKE
jgi:hypothetical protein